MEPENTDQVGEKAAEDVPQNEESLSEQQPVSDEDLSNAHPTEPAPEAQPTDAGTPTGDSSPSANP